VHNFFTSKGRVRFLYLIVIAVINSFNEAQKAHWLTVFSIKKKARTTKLKKEAKGFYLHKGPVCFVAKRRKS